jgi:hypothetical protein
LSLHVVVQWVMGLIQAAMVTIGLNAEHYWQDNRAE